MAVNYTDLEKMLENGFLEVILKLAIIFFVAVIFSVIAKKIRMPGVLGFIIGGIVLGFLLGGSTPFTYFTDALHFTIDGKDPIIYDLAQIGVVLLLFQAGLETNFHSLKKYFSRASVIAVGGVSFSIALVLIGMLVLKENMNAAIGMSVALASTSISISIQTLKDLKQRKRLSSILTLESAIIDDIIGLLLLTLLGVFMSPSYSGINADFFITIGKIVVLFLAIGLIGLLVIKLNKRLTLKRYIANYSKQILMLIIAFCFLLSFFAQILGVSVIIGAYFAGLMFSTTSLKHHVTEKITPITEIVFAPIFFMSIGLSIDLQNVQGTLLIGLAISVLAILGKVIGCSLGSRVTGFNLKNALKIGIGMVPRGEVSFIVVSLASSLGLLNAKHMSIAVVVIIVTSIITPALLKVMYKND